MRSFVLRVAVALAPVILALAARPAAAQPPPPSDAELTAYIAVQDALVADTGHRDEICELITAEAPEEDPEESGDGDDLAAAARRAESDPIFGPLLRRAGLSGQRYVELSVQVFGVLLGAAMADGANARQTLLASSADAPPILAREQDLTRALTAVQAMCPESEDDLGYDEEEWEEPGRA